MAQQEHSPVVLGVKRATLAKFDGDPKPTDEPLCMITSGDGLPTALLMRPLDVSKLSREEIDALTALATKAKFDQGADLPTWADALAHSRKRTSTDAA